MEDNTNIESSSAENGVRNKKIIIVVAILTVVAVAIAGSLYFFDLMPSFVLKTLEIKKPQVVDENLVVPDTQNLNGTDARFGGGGSVQTPLVPKDESEKVIVAKAVLTVKGGYDLAMPEAKNWDTNAKLTLIKSLGAVTLDGKSSQWQIAFSSATQKGKGYEVIIQADQIVSKKEIDSTAVGADIPATFKDSGEAVAVLQELPQYSDASLSAISLYYNTDGKVWRYTLTTSKGGVSTAAQ